MVRHSSTRSFVVVLTAAAMACTGIACSGGGDPSTAGSVAIATSTVDSAVDSVETPAQPLELSVAFEAAPVDAGAGVSAQVGPSSASSLTALVAPGVTVTLDLPAGAVTEAVDVTVRPVVVDGNVGVVLEPEGLFLARSGRLRFDGSLGAVFQRTGWSIDGVARFVPSWRTADEGVAVSRLRPVVVVEGRTPDGQHPEVEWDTDVMPLLGDPRVDRSDASDRAAWEMERSAEDGDEPDPTRIDEVAAAGEARGRVLAQRCADRQAPRMTAEELSDLIDGGAVRITDAKEVAGCLVLAWRVTETVQGQFEVNGESVEIDEVQTASTVTMIDGGSSSSSAPLFGRSNGQGGIMSVAWSLMGKGFGEYAGVETPDVTSTLCHPVEDQEAGSLTLDTDPLPDGHLRVRITVQPGLLDVGCGPDLKLPPLGWDLVSALRGEEPGTPMVLTLPVQPQVSHALGFIEQSADASMVRQPDGRVKLTVGQVTFVIGFVVSLAFAPAP